MDYIVSKPSLGQQMRGLGMRFDGLAKIWFYTLCLDYPEGVRVGQHNQPEQVAKICFQSDLA